MRVVSSPWLVVTIGPVALASAISYANPATSQSLNASSNAHGTLPDTLPPCERVLDATDSTSVATLNGRIIELRRQARYAEAIEPAEKTLRIRQAVQGDEHWETGDAARLLATLRHVASLPREAQARLAEADRSDDVVVQLFARGDYEAAADAIRKNLAVRREILGDHHFEVVIAVDDLASVLWTTGDYARAEPLFRHALVLNRRILSTDHPNLARAMNNLAVVLISQGDLKAAETLCREALAINRRLLGSSHPHVVADLGNLGVILQCEEDLDGAEECFREAISLGRIAYGDDLTLRAHDLFNLIQVLRRKEDLSGAEATLHEALDLCHAMPDSQNRQYAGILRELSLLRMRRGEFAAAESTIRRALALTESAGGSAHLDLVVTRYRLAQVLHLRGNYAEAETAWAAAQECFDAMRSQTGLQGLERVHFTSIWCPFDYYAACLVRNGKHRAAWEQLEANLAHGLSDEMAARIVRPLTREQREILQAHHHALATIDEQINTLLRSGESDAATIALQDSLLLALEEQQAALSLFEEGLSATYGDATMHTPGLEPIQAWLTPEQALLMWVDVTAVPGAADPRGERLACVVRDTGDPWWVRLPGTGPGGAWTGHDDSLAIRLRDALQAPRSESGGGVTAEMYHDLCEQRITPARDALRGVRHLVIVPSGAMVGVPVEALADTYTVSYAPSATVLVSISEHPDHELLPGSLLALGDPVLQSSGPEKQTTRASEMVASLRSEAYGPLPGTRIEVQTLARLFEEVNPRAPTVLVGPDAREQQVSAAAANGELASFSYLHFATHAVVNDLVPLQSALILSREDPQDEVERAIRGEAVYDGLITAEQILRTWRLSADLVTLSACETARGRASRGEGYVGFSQALFAAGARSLLLSLWKVEDRATTLLMIRFYENLLGAHQDVRNAGDRAFEPGMPLPKAEALQEAKHWLRSLTKAEAAAMLAAGGSNVARGLVPVDEPVSPLDAEFPFADPHYWAAFILVGDPR